MVLETELSPHHWALLGPTGLSFGFEALADDGKIIATARRAEESMEFLETLEEGDDFFKLRLYFRFIWREFLPHI